MCALRDDYEKSKRGVLLLPEDRRQRQGAWLLIASLGIFFFSSLLLYFVYVAMRLRVDVDEPMSFHLPRSFIASTMLLLGISYCLHLSAQAARFDRVSQLIGLTFASLVMGILFLLIQTEGMYRLVEGVRESASPKWSVYSFTLFLAVVHALHVVGGVIALGWVVVKAMLKKYDHERHYGVQFCAMYWHFLDLVWLIMLVTFVALVGWLTHTR